MRRLPVYILIDTSGSMRGEPIQSVNVGLQSLLTSLRQDPHTLDSVWLSIITFDREVKSVLDLTELSDVQLPRIVTPDSGPTFLGAALNMVCDRIQRDVTLSSGGVKGDWMPLLFIMTDGKPSDLMDFREAVKRVNGMHFGLILGCAAGDKAKEEFLQEVTDNVVKLDTTDATAFQHFFKFVSDSVALGGQSVGLAEAPQLPPPPPEINLVA